MKVLDIYHEHVEEASFLYNLRNYLLARPKGGLSYQQTVEERLEAHISALELGGMHSEPLLKTYLASKDEGECFGAICALLRMGRMQEVLAHFDAEPVQHPQALSRAFRLFESGALNDKLLVWLASGAPERRGVAASVLGINRAMNAAAEIAKLLDDDDQVVRTCAMKAITRLQPDTGRGKAFAALSTGEGDSEYKEACFENLFLRNDAKVFGLAERYSGKDALLPAAVMMLGLRAAPEDSRRILSLVHEHADRSVFQAVGFFGSREILMNLVPLEKSATCNAYIQEAAHLVLGTEPPEIPEHGEERTSAFALSEALSRPVASDSRSTMRWRLGRPATRENEKQLAASAAAIYRKWLYLDMCRTGKSSIGIEHDDTAARQLMFYR